LDDIQKIKNPSLKARIRKRMVQLTLIYSVLSILIIGLLSFNEAKEQQDDLLIEVSKLINRKTILLEDRINFHLADKNDEAIIIHKISNDNKKPEYKLLKSGLHTLMYNNEELRVYVGSLSNLKKQLFFVGQSTESRNEYAWNSCLSFSLPTIILLIFLILIVNYIIKFHFQALEELGRELESKDPLMMEQLSEEGVFLEILPFLRSINSLLKRSKDYIVGQNLFIANAAHELRTPITAISLQVENLLNSDAEERKEREAYIAEGLKRLRVMVGKLLDFSKVDKSQNIENKKESFLTIIKEVIADLYPLVEHKKINLNVIHDEDLYIYNKMGEVNSLVKNAIENAIKFSCDEGDINIILKKSFNQAIFRVENFNVSVSKEDMEKIAKPFYKIDQEKEGSGLGLSICYKVAKKMNGKLTLEVTDDKVFKFSYSQAIVNQ
jgi:signal transduction histidine kinase